MSVILTIQELEKAFGNRVVLDKISFDVRRGERIALVGLNGSGKSTLLGILMNQVQADDGRVIRRRRLSVAYVPQEPRFADHETVDEVLRQGLLVFHRISERLEALAQQIGELQGQELDVALDEQASLHEQLAMDNAWDPAHELRKLSAALSLPEGERPVAELSIGERRRLAIARALLMRAELLALDEPTNHLDAATVDRLERILLEHRGALLFVTHDRYLLDRVATRIIELDRGQAHSYDGGYTDFLEKQAQRLENEAARERDRAAFVRREIDWIRRGPCARGTKQKARIERFDNAVAEGSKLVERAGNMQLRLPTGGRLGKSVLELSGLSKTLGGKLLFRELDLLFKPGDRVGVLGPNGIGKTTLMRTILGELPPDSGEVKVASNTRFAFLDQGRSSLRDERSVLDEVADGNDHVLLEGGAVHVRSFLRMLLFDDGFAQTPVGALSGGERNRVQLAKLLRAGANFLMLDEPTNDLDVLTLAVLEDALCAFGGCVLVVSHDRYFLDKVATHILAFEGDGRVVLHAGNCSDYLQRREAEQSSVTPRAKAVEAVVQSTSCARKLSFSEKRELEGIEAQIAEAERAQNELEAALQSPELYAERAAEVPRLVESLAAAQAQVEALYARWQELESKR
ncbi:MAG: ABC-F family ATP-binding cassette domain-containing protein [Myxococcota bacterium]|jgi:ATP-binding cassette subfamily F protein uup|nr:ABC-F family ATP-binding cassette domain-containing protein [Myxococcota bacterium]